MSRHLTDTELEVVFRRSFPRTKFTSGFRTLMREAIQAALTQASPADAVPEGFWLAPMEADVRMIDSAHDFTGVDAARGLLAGAYRAMRDSWLERHPVPEPVDTMVWDEDDVRELIGAVDAHLHDFEAYGSNPVPFNINGAGVRAVRKALSTFRGGPHSVLFVSSVGGEQGEVAITAKGVAGLTPQAGADEFNAAMAMAKISAPQAVADEQLPPLPKPRLSIGDGWGGSIDAFDSDQMRAYALSAQKLAVPDGWVAVPREPTSAMMDAAEAACDDWPRTTWTRAWKMMLSAAPTASASLAAPKAKGEAT